MARAEQMARLYLHQTKLALVRSAFDEALKAAQRAVLVSQTVTRRGGVWSTKGGHAIRVREAVQEGGVWSTQGRQVA